MVKLLLITLFSIQFVCPKEAFETYSSQNFQIFSEGLEKRRRNLVQKIRVYGPDRSYQSFFFYTPGKRDAAFKLKEFLHYAQMRGQRVGLDLSKLTKDSIIRSRIEPSSLFKIEK